MRPLPTKTKTKAGDYSVVTDPLIVEERLCLADAGSFEPAARRILIRTKDQNELGQWATLIHELFHACEEFYGYKQPHKRTVQQEDFWADWLYRNGFLEGGE